MGCYMRTLFILLLAISLSGCGAISSFIGTTIGDYVPEWAGGLPKDAPPRPGDARYQQYIEEQRTKLDTSKPATKTPKKEESSDGEM